MVCPDWSVTSTVFFGSDIDGIESFTPPLLTYCESARDDGREERERGRRSAVSDQTAVSAWI